MRDRPSRLGAGDGKDEPKPCWIMCLDQVGRPRKRRPRSLSRACQKPARTLVTRSGYNNESSGHVGPGDDFREAGR